MTTFCFFSYSWLVCNEWISFSSSLTSMLWFHLFSVQSVWLVVVGGLVYVSIVIFYPVGVSLVIRYVFIVAGSFVYTRLPLLHLCSDTFAYEWRAYYAVRYKHGHQKDTHAPKQCDNPRELPNGAFSFLVARHWRGASVFTLACGRVFFVLQVSTWSSEASATTWAIRFEAATFCIDVTQLV